MPSMPKTLAYENHQHSPMAVSKATTETTFLSSTTPPPKKKRHLPGTPDPDAEVIALSPKTLLATNRFVCEICGKGFQRDQNLQLHRRGHNLPWKLGQSSNKEGRKKVYVCPEASCVHNNPSRALGDLTGIKKHFCRKHGEKKWACQRCSKKYAVQSDWKAHMKTCGTREYRCDCGTLFFRRDNFITHRAFCDALVKEGVKAKTLPTVGGGDSEGNVPLASSPPQLPLTPSTSMVSPTLSIQSSSGSSKRIMENQTANDTTSSSTRTSTRVFASIFASSTSNSSQSSSIFSNNHTSMPISRISIIDPTSLSLSTSFYLSNTHDTHHYINNNASPQLPPSLSATALLQKAAQMGPATSNASLVRGLGLATTSSSHQDHSISTTLHAKQENMMKECSSSPFTRDLLGLTKGPNRDGVGTRALSALFTSFKGSFDPSKGES